MEVMTTMVMTSMILVVMMMGVVVQEEDLLHKDIGFPDHMSRKKQHKIQDSHLAMVKPEGMEVVCTH